MSGYRYPGKPSSEMQAAHQVWVDASPLITRCVCGWSFEGTAAEGRELAKGHRRVAHPDVKAVRRRRGSLQRFNASSDEFQAEGIANAAEVAAMHAKRERAA